MKRSTAVDVFISLLSRAGKPKSTGKVLTYGTMHAFLLDHNTLIVAVEGEGCVNIPIDELTTVSFESLCIHLAGNRFISPCIESVASAIFSAILWLYPKEDMPKLLPSTELASGAGTEPQIIEVETKHENT